MWIEGHRAGWAGFSSRHFKFGGLLSAHSFSTVVLHFSSMPFISLISSSVVLGQSRHKSHMYSHIFMLSLHTYRHIFVPLMGGLSKIVALSFIFTHEDGRCIGGSLSGTAFISGAVDLESRSIINQSHYT